jgi:hypothetical protein
MEDLTPEDLMILAGLDQRLTLALPNLIYWLTQNSRYPFRTFGIEHDGKTSKWRVHIDLKGKVVAVEGHDIEAVIVRLVRHVTAEKE